MHMLQIIVYAEVANTPLEKLQRRLLPNQTSHYSILLRFPDIKANLYTS